MLTQGSTFTYQDVLDQLLVYTPETVSGGADEMHFTLTDGVFRQTGRLEFTMDVRKSEGPRMTVNRGLQLPAGSNSSGPSGFPHGGGAELHGRRGTNSTQVRGAKRLRHELRFHYPVSAGSSSKITEQNLKATDVDSDSLKIRYTLTKDPPAGKLQLSRSEGRVEKVSAKGPVQSFTQDDVNKGAESRRGLLPATCYPLAAPV